MRAAYGHVWKTPRPAAAEHRVPAALFLDAAGTFLLPAENVPDVYLRYARPHGVRRNAEDVLQVSIGLPVCGPVAFVHSAVPAAREVHSLSFHAVLSQWAANICNKCAQHCAVTLHLDSSCHMAKA